ncbi:hypothetical protein A3D05_03150 [Candidatus Gottesmanbacteria bacterium RIFCSPHIGHO2_02_FULL_40_24]|uniref:Glycosyltransferase 2-like domain-containing protein n=1 Tax=Candidatus Gottesmanbacteria bacterium RIFCSPHIGHO2_01_FULL_40_15 TaxID=1798376 RepID=A0A1F5Z0P1_9BACT|nr:MAG: hypothetical protein A2777_04730 [Candidatus Gottesmanbacteria bacterium RIFCSPHIGHO2_01_FULL_40_15]OGG17689.1 MAG: hypothetical protein A3D05_03150 [Candidatus Gottesmanbacteria bacterium RIFCSPHIGHO2_02_FULL_40_24]OGG21604.1 MAG: hypothetical protein A3B48_04825 [Candidatus Gottesmanbacteria bacterium RIFCSPLOWO2_01_FULL_40_10]OGG24796.1 MAG: hypothetical protein A3E42_02380 [Candidatus Gottesmanbacteria bacterium RIFCSPHIGHO2_12_FULL_40_13]OGG33078.1 MAG: hypothetical protein A3I80_0
MVKNLSVLIPARNEEPNIKILLPQLLKKYSDFIGEIILINDCSTDGTKRVLRQLKKGNPKIKTVHRRAHPGVGNALKDGIKKLNPNSEYVLFMDCDFLANIGDIGKMVRRIKNYDGIIGSRFIRKNSLVSYPYMKKLVNRSYHYLARFFLKIPNSDLTNNFKLYRTSLVKKVFPLLSSSDFAVNAELGFFPVLMHNRIGEIPVSWQERTEQMGLSKFKILKVGPSYLRVFVRLLRFKYLKS